MLLCIRFIPRLKPNSKQSVLIPNYFLNSITASIYQFNVLLLQLPVTQYPALSLKEEYVHSGLLYRKLNKTFFFILITKKGLVIGKLGMIVKFASFARRNVSGLMCPHNFILGNSCTVCEFYNILEGLIQRKSI